jgi:DNA-directed RNA polymerase subunit RPC12/RpoP
MIEKTYKCMRCNGPCILRVQYDENSPEYIGQLQPQKCPYESYRVSWEEVE